MTGCPQQYTTGRLPYQSGYIALGIWVNLSQRDALLRCLRALTRAVIKSNQGLGGFGDHFAASALAARRDSWGSNLRVQLQIR